jgi:hypothetical protein
MTMARRATTLLAAAMVLAALPAVAQPPAGDRVVLPMPWAASPGWAGNDAPPKFDPEATARLGQEPIPEQPPGWAGVPALDCGRDLPCGVRLQGLVGKSTGVFVEGTAFTW